MKKTVFTGVATALITPFDKYGKIDYEKFAELVEFQIREGINDRGSIHLRGRRTP